MMAVRLRNRMEMLGFTNQTLADKSGIPLATVNRIVAGQTENPNVQTLTALAAALDITMDEIVGLMIRSDAPVQPSPVTAAYDNMLQMVQALHKSELQSLRERHQEELARLDEKHRNGIDALERKHSEAMAKLESHYVSVGASKDRWINRQFWVRLIMTAVLITFIAWALFLDSQIGDIGFFRY